MPKLQIVIACSILIVRWTLSYSMEVKSRRTIWLKKVSRDSNWLHFKVLVVLMIRIFN